MEGQQLHNNTIIQRHDNTKVATRVRVANTTCASESVVIGSHGTLAEGNY